MAEAVLLGKSGCFQDVPPLLQMRVGTGSGMIPTTPVQVPVGRVGMTPVEVEVPGQAIVFVLRQLRERRDEHGCGIGAEGCQVRQVQRCTLARALHVYPYDEGLGVDHIQA